MRLVGKVSWKKFMAVSRARCTLSRLSRLASLVMKPLEGGLFLDAQQGISPPGTVDNLEESLKDNKL